MASPQPVLQFDVQYPEHSSRLMNGLLFIKLIAAIPHIIVLYILEAISAIVWFIAWLAIIFTGKYPQGMFNFNLGVMRWGLRLQAYVLLLTDAYPPFSMAPLASPTAGFAGSPA